MTNIYQPDYHASAGDVLREYLDAHGLSDVDLAYRTGLSIHAIHGVLHEHRVIDDVFAEHLERLFYRPKHFWLNLGMR